MSFNGKKGQESKGIVELIAIRKNHGLPDAESYQGDLFEIILIQDHLAAALHEFSELAEGLAIALRAQFANKTVIEPADPIVCLH